MQVHFTFISFLILAEYTGVKVNISCSSFKYFINISSLFSPNYFSPFFKMYCWAIVISNMWSYTSAYDIGDIYCSSALSCKVPWETSPSFICKLINPLPYRLLDDLRVFIVLTTIFLFLFWIYRFGARVFLSIIISITLYITIFVYPYLRWGCGTCFFLVIAFFAPLFIYSAVSLCIGSGTGMGTSEVVESTPVI